MDRAVVVVFLYFQAALCVTLLSVKAAKRAITTMELAVLTVVHLDAKFVIVQILPNA